MKTPQEYAKHAREMAVAFKVLMVEMAGMDPLDAKSYPTSRLTEEQRQRLLGGANADKVGAIVCAPVSDARTYIIALHEMGHTLAAMGSLCHERDRAQSQTQNADLMLAEEEAAWDWAAHYALEWTADMQAVKDWAYGTYQQGRQQAPLADQMFGSLFGAILGEIFGVPVGPMGPMVPPEPSRTVDPNAGKRMAATHARTARSIVDSIKKGCRS